MTLTLYSQPTSPRVQKALIAAAYGGVDVKFVENFQMGVTNKTPEFLAKHPAGKVPLLDTPQGPIFESNAIAKYIARISSQSNLLGKCFYSKALVDQWVDYVTFELGPPCFIVVSPIMGFGSPDAAMLGKARDAIDAALAVLDKHLVSNTFIVGNYITLADIIGFCTLSSLFKVALHPGKPYPRVTRWFNTLAHQPEFKGVIGEFKYVDNAGLEEKEIKENAPVAPVAVAAVPSAAPAAATSPSAAPAASGAPAPAAAGGKKDKKKDKKKDAAPSPKK
eukprot:TRINITY_DN63281_c0_g1_i1.p1 TRINITY_DN63281_c0_g1~~TRINITY_DN63281_c0_g1_i1.p1  ORF type:complete len:278 (+),score=83.36 TRINITY_DN63281_c0_g1_i1:147-980(+)